MKTLVVYDTKWGNTEKIAAAIADGVGGNARAVKIDGVTPEEAGKADLLIIGSPVIGGKPTKPIQAFLKTIVPASAPKRAIATFDTRMTMKLAQRFGFAAVKMADQLKAQGNTVVSEPMGFIVTGQKGPLAEGEMERATLWGKSLEKSV
jgi:flavodoxin